MEDYRKMSPSKLLIGLGILGRLLQREQPITTLRQALVAQEYNDNEISVLFDFIRHEKIRGLSVNARRRGGVIYWRLPDSIEVVS